MTSSGASPFDEEKRALLLMKLPSSTGGLTGRRYELRHIWYNPHDPGFLRYSRDKDFRGVRVIPIQNSHMTCQENRIGPKAETLVLNCHKKWKIKFSTKTKAWALYFQTAKDFSEWSDLFVHVREEEQHSAHQRTRTPLQENWWQSRYGSSSNGCSATGQSAPQSPAAIQRSRAASASPSLILSQRAPVMFIVELPHSLGFMRLGVHKLDVQVITVERFKERLFEALHMFLHQSALVLHSSKEEFAGVSSQQQHTTADGSPTHRRRDTSSSSSSSICPPYLHTSPLRSNRYGKKTCNACLGSIRQPLMSRQMFSQEQAIEQGPDFFVFQIGSVFSTKDYRPKDVSDVNIVNDRFLRGGGLFKQHQQSSQDELLLKSFEFIPSQLGSPKPKPAEDCLDWVEDETIALSTLLERTAPNRPVSDADGALVTQVVHLILRPSRDLPLSRFFMTCTRYTREYDALKTFSSYVSTVRHGQLKWEVRRQYAEFRDLDACLRTIDSGIPRLPQDARRLQFSWRSSSENDELRLIRELNVYLRLAISERTWDPPPIELLTFLGVLSTGKNKLLTNSVTRNRRVVHLDALAELAEFGDIVLFRSVNPMAGLQRKITGNCTFDHIGIVVKRKRAGYELLEATGEGVTSYALEDRLEAYFGGFCDLIALRKVRFERSEEISRALAEFTNQVEGKPYKLSLGKLATGRVKTVTTVPAERKAEYFCSELVAEALRVIGVMSSKGRPDSFFLPHFFDEGGPVDALLTGGSSLDDLVFVDCRNPEVKFSKNTNSNGGM